MPETNNELNEAAKAGDLENLPEGERKETQEILQEIDAENKRETTPPEPDPKDKKPEGEEPGDGKEKKSAEEKPQEKKPDGEGKKPEEKPETARRDPKFIPAWQYKILEKRLAEKDGELKAKIEELAGKAPDDLSKKGQDDLNQEAEKIAEDEGVSPTLVKRLLEVARKNAGPSVPENLMTKLEELDHLRAEREVEVEEAKFSRDFDAMIVPLVRAEYGVNVPAHVIEGVKNDLKELAYSVEYGKIPYATIYKGEDQFRNLVAPAKKGAEDSSGGTFHKEGAHASGGRDLTKPIPEAEIRKLSDADFETYMKNMVEYEKKNP